ncbi:hypothetical protein VD659_09650 [Herbiconiux sp. 11R-BC]|uniref:hypothetical protein n=1 Tax=Herbiconiux sp. 11R-BC TaxID=3111637 RepID=UPI003C0F5776
MVIPDVETTGIAIRADRNLVSMGKFVVSIGLPFGIVSGSYAALAFLFSLSEDDWHWLGFVIPMIPFFLLLGGAIGMCVGLVASIASWAIMKVLPARKVIARIIASSVVLIGVIILGLLPFSAYWAGWSGPLSDWVMLPAFVVLPAFSVWRNARLIVRSSRAF